MRGYFNFCIATFLCLMLSSCPEQSSSVMVTRIISNKTANDVLLDFFEQNESKLKIVIPSNDADTAKENCEFAMGSLQACSVVFSLKVDSIRLNFDDGQVLTYIKDGKDYNFINNKNIMILDIEDPSLNKGYEQVADNVFVFTIEESDYEAAEPIE